jgi:aminoglycoside 2'-N-acetyltransferase I
VRTLRRLTTADLSAADTTSIRGLLDDAFASAFSEDDWEHACGGTHVVVTDTDTDVIVGHAAVVPRAIEVGGRPFAAGYVEAVATAPARQGEGLGSLAMTAVAEILRAEYELGALSTGRHRFYARLGWERWRGPTFVRRDTDTIRTDDEDEGVMVLRFGPSANLDLHAAISCAARRGDDW